MVIVFRFKDGERKVRLVGKDVIDFLRISPLHCLAADDDATPGDVDLLAELRHYVPLIAIYSDKRRCDELGANISFGEGLLVHLSMPQLDEAMYLSASAAIQSLTSSPRLTVVSLFPRARATGPPSSARIRAIFSRRD